MRRVFLTFISFAALALVAISTVALTATRCAEIVETETGEVRSACEIGGTVDDLVAPFGVALAVLMVGAIGLLVTQTSAPRSTSRPSLPMTPREVPRTWTPRDPETVRYAGLYAHRIVRTICWSPLPIILVTSLFAFLSVQAVAPELGGIVGSGGVLSEVVRQTVKTVLERLF